MDSIQLQLNTLPRYQTSSTNIEASFYNLIKLALLRKEQALRFSVNELKSLDVILTHDYWVCVDTSLNNIPVFAWTEFADKHRNSLHEAIPAKIYTYHAHAELIIEKVTNQIRAYIDLSKDKLEQLKFQT